jgi:XTP/dITP diphosphohydrolase
MKIVLATHNKHKVEELTNIADGDIEFIPLPDDFPEIEEDGETLEENALLKARFVHIELRMPTLADDTGLEVEALDGAPGVITARYAGENATYQDNCRKMLREMEGKQNRKAVFRTVLCYLDQNGLQHLFEGKVEGEISTEEHGTNGFGYDPVFIPTDGVNTLTFAEMTSDNKNKISHRSRALQAFLAWMNENGTE